MDDISLLDPDTRSLVEKYLLGPAEVAGQALGAIGSQSINGLAGLAGGLYRAGQGAFRGDSPRKILQDSTDAAADIMDAEPVHMPEMSTAGQQTISRDLAPAITDFMRSRAGQATAKTAHQIASVGRKGIDAATAAAAGRVAPEVQGAVAALAEAAPQELLRPFGAAARTIGDIPKFAEEAAGAGAASFAVPKEFVGHAPIDQLIDHGINPGDYHPKYIKGLLTAIASGTDPQIAAEVAQRALKMHPEVFGPFGNYKPPKSAISAMDEYQANMKAAGDLIKRGAVPDSAPADDALHFVHYSNLSDPIVDTSQALHGDPTDNIHVVFKPNQIKSAIGNSGAYSLDDPDITKKTGGQVFAKGGAVKQIAKLIAKYGDAAVLHDTAAPEDAVETFLKSRYGKVAPPPESLAGVTVGAPVPPSELEQYLRPPPRKPVKYKAGEPTVDPVQRVAFPGIYKPANQAVAEASARVGPEDPLLHRLFGVNRADLTDIAMSRQGNELGILPGAKPNATGAKSALGVMNPRNEQRLIDVLAAAKQDPKLRDMIGWYTADPLYERFRQIYGDDMSPREFELFRHLTGMASPGSDVGTELNRGTAAYWLNKQGRFPDFMKYAGQPTEARGADFPDDMRQVMGHPYHRTAQGEPMLQYLNSGQLQMKSPKAPPYIQAFGSPETGFQTDLPVGDAHWSRGVGLADTRDWRYSKGEQKVPGSSVSTPEAQTLAPWWRSKVADQVGLESVPAQALLWGAYAPQTGVETTIGAPKLEILATQIGKVATRLGVSPETARDMVITGQTGAF